MTRFLKAVCLILIVVVGGQAQAHDLRPAYLAINEDGPATYSVFWKSPAMNGLRLALYPRLPESTAETSSRQGIYLNDAYIERWDLYAPDDLAGGTISIEGLTTISTDVLVRIERLNGETVTERLTPARPSFEIPAASGPWQVAAAYLWLGVEHILFGVDHLLFVLTLIILVCDWKRIALTVTAFTLAHSITLAAATLGFVNVPGPPVEAAIALSIALVAAEIVNSVAGRASLTARLPWLIAFTFGLLHGFGFAGALSEVGLPSHAIPVALLFFNIGVELGQLLFVAGVIALFSRVHRLSRAFLRSDGAWAQTWPRVAGAYCIGGVASFWLIERVSGFWG